MAFIEVILLGYGFYLIYMIIKMKSTGTIPKGLVSNRINLERSHDIPGFIKFMYVRGLVFGALLCIFSGILLYNDLVENSLSSFFIYAVELFYTIAIVYYAVVTVKAQNKFLF